MGFRGSARMFLKFNLLSISGSTSPGDSFCVTYDCYSVSSYHEQPHLMGDDAVICGVNALFRVVEDCIHGLVYTE